jgi:hypothetical protein
MNQECRDRSSGDRAFEILSSEKSFLALAESPSDKVSFK